MSFPQPPDQQPDQAAEAADQPDQQPHQQPHQPAERAGQPDQPARSVTPARPVTGDPGVDRVLQELDGRLEGGTDEQVEAVTEAHRQLQARLTTPTPPASPGQARPGPR